MKLRLVLVTIAMMFTSACADFVEDSTIAQPVAQKTTDSLRQSYLPGKYHISLWTGEVHPLYTFRIASRDKELLNVLPETSIRIGFRYGLTGRVDLLAEYYGGYFQCGDSSTGYVLPTISGPGLGIRYNFEKTKIIFNNTYPFAQASIRYVNENISVSKWDISEDSHGFSCGFDLGTDIRLSSHFSLPVGICYFYGKAADNISIWEWFLGVSYNFGSK